MSKKVLKTFETLSGKHELSLVCGVYPPKPVDQCEQDEIWYCINGVSVTPQEFAQFYNFESPFASFGKLGYDRYRREGR